jgi:hypothetical protein
MTNDQLAEKCSFLAAELDAIRVELQGEDPNGINRVWYDSFHPTSTLTTAVDVLYNTAAKLRDEADYSPGSPLYAS